jgi:hypothetical protein
MKTMRLLGCVVTIGAMATLAHGYSFLNSLYNTGIDADGNKLSTATKTIDPHYTLQSNHAGLSTAYAVSGFNGYWNTTDYSDGSKTYKSSWISPVWDSGQAGNIYDNPNVGLYNYTLTFDLGGRTPAEIKGQWMSDNGTGSPSGVLYTSQILVNGLLTGQTIGSTALTDWNSFILNGTYNDQSYFHTGVNTITFSVSNWPSTFQTPTGVRVVFTSADAVPEPFTLGILGVGVLSLAISRRRRRNG